MIEINNVVFVGVGGIGSWLSNIVCRLLCAMNYRGMVTLVDGDKKEDKNEARQELVGSVGEFKADLKARELAVKFPEMTFKVVNKFIGGKTTDTLVTPEEVIPEGSIVFCAPDNHICRKEVLQTAQGMDNVIAIVGGNEDIDGSAFMYVRKNGIDVVPNPLLRHDAIANAGKRKESCVTGTDQTMLANIMVAAHMSILFERATKEEHYVYETGFNLSTFKSYPVCDMEGITCLQ